MIVWRIMAQEKKQLDELWQNMTRIVWLMNNPPEPFDSPDMGTDNLRWRPALDLKDMLTLSRRMLADLETLWLAHHPIGARVPWVGKK